MRERCLPSGLRCHHENKIFIFVYGRYRSPLENSIITLRRRSVRIAYIFSRVGRQWSIRFRDRLKLAVFELNQSVKPNQIISSRHHHTFVQENSLFRNGVKPCESIIFTNITSTYVLKFENSTCVICLINNYGCSIASIALANIDHR